MLQWKVMTGDEKLRNTIEDRKKNFDKWFEKYWSKKTTKEVILSPESPNQFMYYMICKTPEEIKMKYPYEASEYCISCQKYVSKWIEAPYKVEEYGNKLVFCNKCIKKMNLCLNTKESKK